MNKTFGSTSGDVLSLALRIAQRQNEALHLKKTIAAEIEKLRIESAEYQEELLRVFRAAKPKTQKRMAKEISQQWKRFHMDTGDIIGDLVDAVSAFKTIYPPPWKCDRWKDL